MTEEQEQRVYAEDLASRVADAVGKRFSTEDDYPDAVATVRLSRIIREEVARIFMADATGKPG